MGLVARPGIPTYVYSSLSPLPPKSCRLLYQGPPRSPPPPPRTSPPFRYLPSTITAPHVLYLYCHYCLASNSPMSVFGLGSTRSRFEIAGSLNLLVLRPATSAPLPAHLPSPHVPDFGFCSSHSCFQPWLFHPR